MQAEFGQQDHEDFTAACRLRLTDRAVQNGDASLTGTTFATKLPIMRFFFSDPCVLASASDSGSQNFFRQTVNFSAPLLRSAQRAEQNGHFKKKRVLKDLPGRSKFSRCKIFKIWKSL